MSLHNEYAQLVEQAKRWVFSLEKRVLVTLEEKAFFSTSPHIPKQEETSSLAPPVLKKKQEPKPVQPVVVKEEISKPVLKQAPIATVYDELCEKIKKGIPQLKLIREIPLGKSSPFLFFVCEPDEEEKELIHNLHHAIIQKLCACDLIEVSKLEAKELETLLEGSWKGIATEKAFATYLQSLEKKNSSLIVLENVSHYKDNPIKKKQLWNCLCTIHATGLSAS